MTRPPATRQVFISHSATDCEAAEAIRVALEAAGTSCWIAPRDIPAGTPWAAAIMAGIAEVRLVLLVHSAASATSEMVLREVNAAIDGKTPVVPVRIDATPVRDAMQFYLGGTHWFDASLGPLAARLGKIVGAASERLVPAGVAAPAERPALALPDKPSLVVLPFQNMSGDPEQEYFVDGLVEDITTALSCIRSLFVIARNSAFTYKGRAVDIRQVGRDLGVRYVLEGSVRKSGTRVRITGQLIEAETGAHLWANRYDGALDDVFDLQDQITASVAGAIEPHLQRAEIERAQRKPTEHLGAYDYFLHGMGIFHTGSSDRLLDAKAMFAKAIALDHKYGAAYGMAGFCIDMRKSIGLLPLESPEIEEGVQYARLAALHGREDPTALAHAGEVLAFLSFEHEAGIVLIERACELNPNSAGAWLHAGLVRSYLGEHVTAIGCFERAMRLSPVDPELYITRTGLGVTYFDLGQYDEAVSCLERAFSEQPSFLPSLRALAAAYAMAGRLDDARRTMADFMRKSPHSLLSDIARGWAMLLRDREAIARKTEAYRLAGMPE